MRIRVENMRSPGGNAVANQFVIEVGDEKYMQSYNTIVARIDCEGRVTLDPKWNFSKTTAKWVGRFLGEDASTVQEKVRSGVYAVGTLQEERK